MKRWKRATAALSASLLLVLGACGGGGDDAADQNATGTQDTSSSTTAQAQGGAVGGLPTGLDAKCLSFARYAAAVGAAVAAAVNPLAAAELEKLQDDFDLDDVPADLRDDFEVMLEYAEGLGGVLAKYPTASSSPDPAALAAILQYSQSVDQPRLSKASDNLEAWLEANCPG